MKIVELHGEIRKLITIDWRQNERILEKELLTLLVDFMDQVSNETDAGVLRAIIDQNREDLVFPIECMFEVYKRAIALSPRDAAMISGFADYLLLFGPDWAEEAEEIERCIQDHKIEAAVRVVMQVSYDKYQQD